MLSPTELFRKEKDYFQKLHSDTQKMLLTIGLYYLTAPIFGIFVNAFLWRQTQDILLVAFYNAIMFSFITAGFYLNGFLLRRYSVAVPYTLSLVISCFALTVLLFLPHITYPIILFYGIIDGVTAGVYWANRNLLTLKTTASDNRIYFSSIETTISTLSKVFIPFVIGWFITLGSILNWYTPVQGYQMLVVYLLIVIFFLGKISRTMESKKQPIEKQFVKSASKKWQHFRLLQFVLGVNNATLTFIPVLLVLTLLGKENTLGMVQSMGAILASVMVFFGVKSLHIKHRLKLIAIGTGITILGGLIFSVMYSGLGVLIFFACQSIAWPFLWVAISSINYDLIDQDNKDPKYHYAYVSDQEIYLNAGRLVGILIFMAAAFFISNDFALRFAPLLFAFTQILLYVTTKAIEKKKDDISTKLC